MKEYLLDAVKDKNFLPKKDDIIGDIISAGDLIVICECNSIMRKSSWDMNNHKCSKENCNGRLQEITPKLINSLSIEVIKNKRVHKPTSNSANTNRVSTRRGMAAPSPSNPFSTESTPRPTRPRRGMASPPANSSVNNLQSIYNRVGSVGTNQSADNNHLLDGFDVVPQNHKHHSCIARVLLTITIFAIVAGLIVAANYYGLIDISIAKIKFFENIYMNIQI